MAESPTFAREVIATLVRLGISQREAATRIRITPRALSSMCRGQLPSRGQLLKFCAALAIDAEPLLAAAGDVTPRLPGSIPVRGIFGGTGGGYTVTAPVSMNSEPSMGQFTGERFSIDPAYRTVTDFCLRVDGESMCPELCAGDLVGIKAQSDAKSGELVVARLNGVITLARWRNPDGEASLVSDNHRFPAISITSSTDCVIIGVVSWHQRVRLCQ